MRKYKMVTPGVLEVRKNYFIRNAKKCISRYTFTENDLGKPVKVDGVSYLLEGQSDERTFLVKNEHGEYFACPGNMIEKIA
jgi:hypothetical protein